MGPHMWALLIVSLALCGCITAQGSDHQWTLLWLTDPLWEIDYIPKELLKGVPIRNTLYETKSFHSGWSAADQPKYIKEYTIIVTRKSHNEKVSKLIKGISAHIKARGLKAIVLIEVGQEYRYADNCVMKSLGPVSDWPLIISHYFTRDCATLPNLIHVPLGVKSVFKNHDDLPPFADILRSTPQASDRKFLFAFMSAHTTVLRGKFLTDFHSHKYFMPHLIRYGAHSFQSGPVSNKAGTNSDKGDKDYLYVLQDSIFGLAPEGNVPETWRFWEIMESGAIPVVHSTTVTNYYQYFVPCNITRELFVSDNPAKVLSVLTAADMPALEAQRQRLISAYNLYRDDLQQNVRRSIEAVGTGRPKQFQQRKGLSLSWEFVPCHEEG